MAKHTFPHDRLDPPLREAVDRALAFVVGFRRRSVVAAKASDAGEAETDGPGECERVLRRILEGRQWILEERGANDPPRRMAQMAAIDPFHRTVILFPPCLRWMAEEWDRPESAARSIAGIPTSGKLASRLEGLPPKQREGWLRALALAHEVFHVFAEKGSASEQNHGSARGELDLWGGQPPPRPATIERAARSFAQAITECFVNLYPI